MLARAIREGVGHDGRGIGLPMDWEKFRALSDEDLASSVVVYLRSLPAVRNELPDRQLTADLERARAEGARPLTEPVPEPVFAESWERGRYLVELGSCVGCHTAWRGDPIPGLGGGGDAITARSGDIVYSPQHHAPRNRYRDVVPRRLPLGDAHRQRRYAPSCHAVDGVPASLRRAVGRHL